jgi:hypothetical protein
MEEDRSPDEFVHLDDGVDHEQVAKGGFEERSIVRSRIARGGGSNLGLNAGGSLPEQPVQREASRVFVDEAVSVGLISIEGLRLVEPAAHELRWRESRLHPGQTPIDLRRH